MLFALHCAKEATVHIIAYFKPGQVSCLPDGQGWSYCDCELRAPYYAVHIICTMITVLIARNVFVTTVDRRACLVNLKGLYEEIVHLTWQNQYLPEDPDSENEE